MQHCLNWNQNFCFSGTVTFFVFCFFFSFFSLYVKILEINFQTPETRFKQGKKICHWNWTTFCTLCTIYTFIPSENIKPKENVFFFSEEKFVLISKKLRTESYHLISSEQAVSQCAFLSTSQDFARGTLSLGQFPVMQDTKKSCFGLWSKLTPVLETLSSQVRARTRLWEAQPTFCIFLFEYSTALNTAPECGTPPASWGCGGSLISKVASGFAPGFWAVKSCGMCRVWFNFLQWWQ